MRVLSLPDNRLSVLEERAYCYMDSYVDPELPNPKAANAMI